MNKLYQVLQSYFILLTTGWHTLYFVPPNERVIVKDENGNTAFADPTYYPFECVKMDGDEKKPYGWRSTPVFYKDGIYKWDGGWMILCEKLTSKIDSDIIMWKKVKP